MRIHSVLVGLSCLLTTALSFAEKKGIEEILEAMERTRDQLTLEGLSVEVGEEFAQAQWELFELARYRPEYASRLWTELQHLAQEPTDVFAGVKKLL